MCFDHIHTPSTLFPDHLSPSPYTQLCVQNKTNKNQNKKQNTPGCVVTLSEKTDSPPNRLKKNHNKSSPVWDFTSNCHLHPGIGCGMGLVQVLCMPSHLLRTHGQLLDIPGDAVSLQSPIPCFLHSVCPLFWNEHRALGGGGIVYMFHLQLSIPQSPSF